MLLNVKNLAKGENFGLRLRRFRFISVSRYLCRDIVRVTLSTVLQVIIKYVKSISHKIAVCQPS